MKTKKGSVYHRIESMPESISRRDFIKTASVSAGAGTLALSGFGCEGQKVKTVKLGRTGLTVSKFFGDQMTDRRVYELAIAAGVNYWHKIGHWGEPASYDIFQKLDRDSFYCDTTVASLDKYKCIEIFERCLQKTGLKCIDGYKVHSQYKHGEDVKNETGPIQAFEQLKKQGKTKFFAMSQHVNTSEIFEAAVESDMFDLIQIPLNPTVPRDYFSTDDFKQKLDREQYFATIKKAADKNIAITAMKVFMYGPKFWDEVPDLREQVKKYLPDNQSIATALIHWALDVPGVLAFGNMLLTFEQLKENLMAVGGQLTSTEDKGLKKMSEAIGCTICRMCGACEKANPGGVAVSDILRFRGYCFSTGREKMAREMYAELPAYARVESAKDLLSYEKACPYGLPLTKLLKNAQQLLA